MKAIINSVELIVSSYEDTIYCEPEGDKYEVFTVSIADPTDIVITELADQIITGFNGDAEVIKDNGESVKFTGFEFKDIRKVVEENTSKERLAVDLIKILEVATE